MRSLLSTLPVRLAALALLLSTGFAPRADAQELLHTLGSPNAEAQGFFGRAVAGVPDTDGDGRGDFLVGAENEAPGNSPNSAGRAYVFSGATGALLHTLASPNEETQGDFGSAVAGVSDLDGDGRGDLLVGASGEARAYVFSGATGALLFTLAPPGNGEFSSFGSAAAGLSDLDGDGNDDFLIGAQGRERAYVFSGATGALLRTLASPNQEPNGFFGREVAGVPDADGDGRGDLLVGATGEDPGDDPGGAGRAYLFSGATGALLFELVSPRPVLVGSFGQAVAGVPDLDGDGRGDLAVGSRVGTVSTPSFAGRIFLFSGATGALLREIANPVEEGSAFGDAVAGVSDLDGDGHGDLLVGAGTETSTSGARTAGRAYVLSGATGRLLSQIDSPNAQRNAFFGAHVAAVPDADGDGRSDLLVGASSEASASGLERAGRAYAFSGGGPPLSLVPNALDFGEAGLGATTASQNLTLQNAATTPLRIDALILGGDDPGQFEIASAPATPFMLAPGATATVAVAFAPTRPGPAEALFVAATPAGDRRATLRGIGRDTSGGPVFTVTKTADTDDSVCDADCSLREAIASAGLSAGADTVRFEAALLGQTFTLALGELPITGEVAVDGGGMNVTVSGGDASRVFLVQPGADAELIGLTVRDGHLETSGSGAGILNRGTLTLTACTVRDNYAGGGGGIANEGTLTVTSSTIRSNTGSFGGGGLSNGNNAVSATLIGTTLSGNVSFSFAGGIYNGSTLTLLRSTVSGNSAFDEGGGIYNTSSGRLTLTNSTVSSNTSVFFEGGGIAFGTVTLLNSTVTANRADIFGGGILGAAVTLSNSIVAGNTLGNPIPGSNPDCDRSFLSSNGHNVTGAGTGCSLNGTGDTTVNPANVFSLVLLRLADNGGPTLTHALVDDAANPALDIGGTCGPVDQRGFPAPQDGPDANTTAECDAGSVEAGSGGTPAVTITLVPQNPPVVVPAAGGSFTFTATLTNTTAQAQSVQAWSEATLPNGAVRGPVLGPVPVTLGPNRSVSRTLIQTVPGNAPAGTYRYSGYVGGFPDSPTDSDAFSATKTAAQLAAGSEAPSLSAAWTVVDAQTGEAVTAETRWASDTLPEAAASAAVPTAFALSAAYPNPFRSATTLTLDVPSAADVRLVVYDVLGRSVAVLLDEELEAGSHSLDFDGSALPSGTYLVRVEVGSFAATQRVTLVR